MFIGNFSICDKFVFIEELLVINEFDASRESLGFSNDEDCGIGKFDIGVFNWVSYKVFSDIELTLSTERDSPCDTCVFGFIGESFIINEFDASRESLGFSNDEDSGVDALNSSSYKGTFKFGLTLLKLFRVFSNVFFTSGFTF